MIQRRTRPSFSRDDEERLLAYMQVTRHLSINFGAAYSFHSPQYALKTSLNEAIDKLAEQITGDPKFFMPGLHSTGGRRLAKYFGIVTGEARSQPIKNHFHGHSGSLKFHNR